MNEKTPFIHLLKSPNNYYVFDVNKNEIVAVDAKIYSHLGHALRGERIDQTDDTVQQKIQHLEEMGYLSSKRVKEVRHPYTDILDTFLNRKVRKITLQLTQNCNFRCKYCAYSANDGTQRTHSDKKMSLAMAKETVDFLLNHSQDADAVNIGFYGGEPLLEFDLIKAIVEYSQEIFEGKKLTFAITTNGTLLTDTVVEYFIAHDIGVTLSLDGPKEINDKNRMFAENGNGTFDTVFSNIQHICEKYPAFRQNILINMVMDPQNDFDDINSFITTSDIINKIQVNSTIIDDIDNEQKNVYAEKFTSKFEYHQFLAFLQNAHRIEKERVSPITYQIIAAIQYNMDKMFSNYSLPDVAAPGGPCIPGGMRLFVNADGDFFPCERVSESSSAMQIGNIATGFDMEKAKTVLNIGALTSEQCNNCWAFSHCKLCAKYADDGNCLTGSHKMQFCEGTRQSVNDDFLAMILIHEIKSYYR